LVLSFVTVFSFTPALAEDLISVKDGSFSVNLKDVSLLEVARDIEKQSGIWFRGDETLFQEKISVSFKDLAIEEGLKRILANLNYSLMFDTKNKIAGVMVMGEGRPAGTQPGRPGTPPTRVATPPATSPRSAPAVRSKPSASPPPAALSRRPPRVAPAPQSSATTGAAQSPIPEAFRVQEKAPIPGGPIASDGPLPPAFRTIENAPPPGGQLVGKETPPPSKAVGTSQPPPETEEKRPVNQEDSKSAKNPSSGEEASKGDSTP
jgi:hypothetical protein